MSVQNRSAEPARAVRSAAVACVALAGIAALVGIVAFHQPLAGVAFASGVLLGTINGAAAARLINLPVPFLATSILRLMTLSLLGIGIGAALGLQRIWLVLLGLGVAQLTLSAAALRESLRVRP